MNAVKPLLTVADVKPCLRTPIWLMRQAGRYLPEFLETKKNFANFFEMALNPEAVCEITMQPLRRFDLDAAILFSDILVIPYIMGYSVNFEKNKGPFVLKSANNNKNKEEVYEVISKAIRMIKAELSENHPKVTLIGFAGAPWTVAAYVTEEHLSKDLHKIKGMVFSEDKTLEKLIEEITELTIEYLEIQINAGAEVVKLFDSWAGFLTGQDFRRFVMNPAKKIVEAIRLKFPHVKIFAFPRLAGCLYEEYVKFVKPDVICIDQYVNTQWAREFLCGSVIQGNLDNIILASSKERSVYEAKNIVNSLGKGKFIFNLGHGVIPSTPIENIHAVIEAVRSL